jgi:hypothetical protein
MSDQGRPEELDFDPTPVPEPPPEIDLRTYFQTISAKGKHAMRQKAAEGETMHLAPIGFKNVRQDGRSVTVPDPKTYPLVLEALWLRTGDVGEFLEGETA